MNCKRRVYARRACCSVAYSDSEARAELQPRCAARQLGVSASARPLGPICGCRLCCTAGRRQQIGCPSGGSSWPRLQGKCSVWRAAAGWPPRSSGVHIGAPFASSRPSSQVPAVPRGGFVQRWQHGEGLRRRSWQASPLQLPGQPFQALLSDLRLALSLARSQLLDGARGVWRSAALRRGFASIVRAVALIGSPAFRTRAADKVARAQLRAMLLLWSEARDRHRLVVEARGLQLEHRRAWRAWLQRVSWFDESAQRAQEGRRFARVLTLARWRRGSAA